MSSREGGRGVWDVRVTGGKKKASRLDVLTEQGWGLQSSGMTTTRTCWGTCCLQVHSRSYILKMEARASSKQPIKVYQTTRCHSENTFFISIASSYSTYISTCIHFVDQYIPVRHELYQEFNHKMPRLFPKCPAFIQAFLKFRVRFCRSFSLEAFGTAMPLKSFYQWWR
jgi:hypothetical protein